MGASITVPDNEVAIWTRLLRPDRDDLAPETARFFLGLSFDERDRNRMHELAVKNQDGELSSAEEIELRDYRRVGMQLDILRAPRNFPSEARPADIRHERSLGCVCP